MRILTAVVVALGALASCSGPTSEERARETPVWRAEPDLRVGSVDDPDYALTWFAFVAIGPTGRMYTLHPMEQVVRVFDEDGTSIGYVGGRGDGPGEFRHVLNMGWVADTLWVLDGSGYRFNQFDSDGEFLGSFSVPFAFGEDPMAAGPPRAQGLLFDGTVHGEPSISSRSVAAGVVTSRTPVLMTRDGKVTDTLPTVAFGNSTWAIGDPDNPRQWRMYTTQPFADGPISGFVPGERAVLHLDRTAPETADGAALHLVKISFDGDTIWTRSLPFEPVAVTAREVDSLLDERASQLSRQGNLAGGEGRAREWAAAGFYRPEYKPGASAMLPGRDGSIWLSETRDEGGMASWLVLNVEGDLIGRVLLPQEVTPMVADREHVWGTESDEFDVPYLVRYRIVK